MEQRYQAVLEVLVGGAQVTEVAERFGVSRQWAYRLGESTSGGSRARLGMAGFPAR